MIMLLAGEPNIRGVIAFPMNSKAQDLLMGSPRNCYRRTIKRCTHKIRFKRKGIIFLKSPEYNLPKLNYI